jgi:hypothetical protein
MQQYGLWLQDTWYTPISGLTVNLGVRVDILDVDVDAKLQTDYPEIDYGGGFFGGGFTVNEPPTILQRPSNRSSLYSVDVSPRVSLTYDITNSFQTFANYGIYYNSTNLFYAIAFDDAQAYQYRFASQWNQWVWSSFQPNDVRSEKTYFFQMGFDYRFLDYWTLSVHGTWKDMDDLYTRTEVPDARDVQRFSSLKNTAEAQYWGVDFIVRRRLHQNWTMRFSYTYSQSRGNLEYIDYTSNLDQEDFSNRGEFFNLDWDVPHVFKLSGLFEFPKPKGLEVSAIFTYQSGYPYTSFYRTSITEENLVSWRTIYSGTKNSGRLPDRHRLDMTVAYGLPLSDRYKLRFWLTVYNVFNSFNINDAYNGNGQPISIEPRRYVEVGMNFKF